MSAAHALERCDLCGRQFQYGPVRSFGTYLPAYQLMTCDSCYAANSEGWSPSLEDTVTRNLKAKGLAIPARNGRGLLPRDGY